jgi:hypothetical protein
MRRAPAFLTLFLLLFGVACSDGRPSIEDARQQFRQRYPKTQLVSVTISEDEVVARSFRFRYRRNPDAKEREIEIQFMKNPETKGWVPSPEPPTDLP